MAQEFKKSPFVNELTHCNRTAARVKYEKEKSCAFSVTVMIKNTASYIKTLDKGNPFSHTSLSISQDQQKRLSRVRFMGRLVPWRTCLDCGPLSLKRSAHFDFCQVLEKILHF